MSESEKPSEDSLNQTPTPESHGSPLKKPHRNTLARIGAAASLAILGAVGLAEKAQARTMIDANGVTPNDTLQASDYKTSPSLPDSTVSQVTVTAPSPSAIATPENLAPQTNEKLNPLLRVVIGITTDQDISKMSPDAIKDISNGKEYDFRSALNNRPNVVITKNSQAVFERELTPLEPNALGHTSLSELQKKLGQPDKTVEGSKTYDWSATTYIYASKGFAFVGNKNDGSVFEVQAFKPMTVDDYVQTYGQDLNPGAQPPQEGGPIPNQPPSESKVNSKPSTENMQLEQKKEKTLASIKEASLFAKGYSIIYNHDTGKVDITVTDEAVFNKFLADNGLTLNDFSIDRIRHISRPPAPTH